MSFSIIKDPPQWMLDNLWGEEQKNAGKPCHDCGVTVGGKHQGGCDVARCLATGAQRLSCGCGGCGEDVWTGLWPGIKECYEERFVCFDGATGHVGFDLNRWSLVSQKRLHEKAKTGRHDGNDIEAEDKRVP